MPAIGYLAYLAYAGLEITAAVEMAAVMEAIMMVGSFISYSMASRKKLGDIGGNGVLVNTRSSDAPLPVLYGRHRIAGNEVYLNTTGEDNKFLHMVVTLSEGPIEGIETIYLDDKPITDFGSLAYYEFYNGAGDQPLCQNLLAADPNWNDYMRWTAYLYIRLEYDPDKFTSMPKVTVITKGRKLYDPRNGITAYSDNPALVAYDFMTSKRYGLGINPSFMEVASIIDAANWYESQENPYTFNGAISEKQSFLDNMAEVLVNCRANIIWSSGKYKLLIRKFDTPVMSFNEDEIVADSFTFTIPGLADTPNRVIVKYPDEKGTDPNDLGWATKEQVIEDSEAVLLFDNEERDTDLILIGTTNATQANLLGIYALERARLNKVFNFAVHPRALALEPGDIISVTHPLPGWVNRTVRVTDLTISQDGVVGITVQEEDPALYDAVLNLSPHTYFRTNLPNPLSPVSEVSGVSFIEEEYFNKDTSYTRLIVTFNPATSPFWDYAEAWVSVDGAGYNHYMNARGGFTIEPVKEGVEYKIKLVSVSIQGVRSDIADATEWTYVVIGKNTPPADVQNFRAIPQSDTIVLMWDAVNILDLQGYEIRRGTNWESGIFLGAPTGVSYALNGVAPGTHTFMIKSVDTNGQYSLNYALASATVYGPSSYVEKMSELNQFAPPATWQGNHAYSTGNKVRPTTPNGFYYKALAGGTSGVSQPSWPITNGATVNDDSVIWVAYEDQAFTGIEAYNDPVAGWVLRVLHGGGNLVGTYVSPVYDRGSIVTRRSWPNFDYLFMGTGAAWADQFGATDAWDSVFSSVETWLELFGAYSAGRIKMRIGVSSNGTTWTWYPNFESFVSEQQGRFVRYEVEITDVDSAGSLYCTQITLKEAYWS